jgi:TPR repeat protein
MNDVLKAAGLASLLTLSLQAQADVFGDGLVALQQGDQERAIAIWTDLAEQGDVESQVTLGFLYDTAQGVPGDLERAHHWYQRAAEQGNVIAEVNLAQMYELGDGVKQDIEKARLYYSLAAERGDSQSIKWIMAQGN